MRTPRLGAPKSALGNHPDENHVLWQIPIQFPAWGLADTREDFTVFARWNMAGPMEPYQMSFGGGPRPEASVTLRPTRNHVVIVVIRSLIGEVGERGIRLATQPTDLRVDAPKDAARLLDLGAIWNMASERVNFPPGTHWLTVELRVGPAVVDRAGYRLHVPGPGEDNASFVLTRIGVAAA